MPKMRRISKATFKDIRALVLWVSRDTLDKNRLLNNDEADKAVRMICDYLELDYYTDAKL